MSNVTDILAELRAAREQQSTGAPLLLTEKAMVDQSANQIVRYRDTGAEIVSATRKCEDSSYYMARVLLAFEIGTGFDVTARYNSRDSEIIWYGFDEDVDMVEDLFDQVEPQMIGEVLAEDFQPFGSLPVQKQREDWAIGYARKVGERVRKLYAQSDATDEDKAWRKREVNEALPPCGSGAYIGGGSAAGSAAGERADIMLGHKISA